MARLTFDFVLVDCPSQPDNLLAAWSLMKNAALLQSEGRFLFGQSGKNGRAYTNVINQLYGVMQS